MSLADLADLADLAELAELLTNLIPNGTNQIVDIAIRPRPGSKDDQAAPVKIETKVNPGLVINVGNNQNVDITIRQRPECLHVVAFPIKREKGVKPRLVIHCPRSQQASPVGFTVDAKNANFQAQTHEKKKNEDGGLE